MSIIESRYLSGGLDGGFTRLSQEVEGSKSSIPPVETVSNSTEDLVGALDLDFRFFFDKGHTEGRKVGTGTFRCISSNSTNV